MQGEIPEGKLPYFKLPVFNYHEGYLSTSYNATYYELAQRHPEVPRLTDLQKEAILHFNALARMRYIPNALCSVRSKNLPSFLNHAPGRNLTFFLSIRDRIAQAFASVHTACNKLLHEKKKLFCMKTRVDCRTR